MRIADGQKRTKLRTDIDFEVIDYRGQRGFPSDQEGFLFRHEDQRKLSDRYTGRPVRMSDTYLIRTAAGETGWRIDKMDFGIATAVYGEGRRSHWPTNHEAAKALTLHLEKVRSRVEDLPEAA